MSGKFKEDDLREKLVMLYFELFVIFYDEIVNHFLFRIIRSLPSFVVLCEVIRILL